MNYVFLIGRMTRDAELKRTNSGVSVVNFCLAVPRKKKDAGADFIPCSAFDKLAEIISTYAHKGDRISIAGRLSSRNYESDGRKSVQYDVQCDAVEFLEPKREGGGEAAPAPEFREVNSPDELPF